MLAGLPATVARFISAIVVDAANAGSWGAFAHVLEEVGKSQPTFTNKDATASVARPAIVVGVRAPLDHFLPRTIGWRGSSLPGMSMFEAVLFFTIQATAARLPARLIGRSFVPAIAANEPNRPVKFVHMGKMKDDLSSKAQTSDIFESGHDGLSARRLCQVAARRFSGGPSRFIAQSVS